MVSLQFVLLVNILFFRVSGIVIVVLTSLALRFVILVILVISIFKFVPRVDIVLI